MDVRYLATKHVKYDRFKHIRFEIVGRMAKVTLNRPDIRNAFNDELIKEAIEIFQLIGRNPNIDVVVLTGEGKAFCAGADLNWMKKMITYSRKENVEDAERLVDMLETIDTCPKPVVGRINGHAIGGGCGVVSVCDLAIAASDAKFAFSEVKLGITPATISPYVIRKIGIAATRELFLTGERITAQRAKEIGLLSHVVPAEELDAVVDKKVKLLSSSGPVAMAVVKRMCRSIPNIDPKELKVYTAELIADLRASEEGQEGMGAFLEKRKPKWIK